MSQKQENDECPMWTCKCGKEILKSATGAISTHIDSAECAKNLRAKQKKEKDKNTQPSIETFFNNKKYQFIKNFFCHDLHKDRPKAPS